MAKGKPLTEHEVAAVLQSEIHASLGYIGSDITSQRQKSLEYYFGEPFGNQQEGRSQVVSTDVSDVIESILPTLLRTFAASDEVVKCDPVSAEDEEVAKLMNDTFVNIKVDREERPDIDNVYMEVTQTLTGRGGWPMTIVMTPEKHPFFAGTYFPKKSIPQYKRIGMLELVPAIQNLWKNKKSFRSW